MKKIFGIVGWKNSGKTTLLVSLVEEFVARGLCVSTIKHSSSNLQFDKAGTDSALHQQAGAMQTALVTDKQTILQTKQTTKILLNEMIRQLAPCDLILIEGFKNEPHPKIECIAGDCETFVYETHENIVALACDEKNLSTAHKLQKFSRNDIKKIADFILEYNP